MSNLVVSDEMAMINISSVADTADQISEQIVAREFSVVDTHIKPVKCLFRITKVKPTDRNDCKESEVCEELSVSNSVPAVLFSAPGDDRLVKIISKHIRNCMGHREV